jgi:hypothetical protein
MKTYLGVLDKMFAATLLIVAISTVNTVVHLI